MSDKYEDNLDRGVLSPDHPPIVQVVVMAVSTKDLKAGTILSASNGEYSPVGSSGTPTAVLLEDVAKHTADAGTVTARVVQHGLVVRKRLLDFSTSTEAEAGDTLANKLPTAGIYLTQSTWTASDFE